MRQPQRDIAGILRADPCRGGQNGGQLMLGQAREGVSELWICYPRTEEEAPQAE
jgi:hypothetical protein